jgi:serine/threonine protein kinase
VCKTIQQVNLVLEFCDWGCLRNALDAGAFFSSGSLNYAAILDTAADVAKAMLHLHCHQVGLSLLCRLAAAAVVLVVVVVVA